MLVAENWVDYQLLDTGSGEKLEKWGKYILKRPDPQIIWPNNTNSSVWNNPHAHYHRSNSGGGQWEFKTKIPEKWTVRYENLTFNIQPTGFKHTGLFPEQAVNWNWMMQKIKKAGRPIRVLNLFAYTGGATVACAAAGAEVCHVDASKGMVSWAKDNVVSSGLEEKPVRFIVDDCMKFVQREQRRGKFYDAIIMDPPSYGRGPKGEIWKIEDELFNFVSECIKVLSDKPLFILINSYTTGFSPTVIENILKLNLKAKFKGKVYCGEVGLPVKASGLILPCGIFGRWEE